MAAALRVVITTVATLADAQRLARGAVEGGLAACVQRQAIDSVYRWNGTVQEEPEFRLLFKTTAAGCDALCAWLRAQHPYELPAIHALAPAQADAAYAQWVAAEVSVRRAPGPS